MSKQRASLAALAAACVVLPFAADAARPKPLDLATPEGVMAANRKIQCSTKDNQPATYYWHGDMYSRVPGERDRLLFKVHGMNIRQCVALNDPARGPGFKLVSRELLFYMDPKTDPRTATTANVVRKWKNPWTGEELDVLHVANDPVNSTWWMNGRDGRTPMTWNGTIQGNHWWSTFTVPLFYRDPLGGDYQEYVGGMYHATEMFNFLGDVDDLVDPRRHSADVRIGWVRISGFLPWMKMGDRAGSLYFHTAGRKLAGGYDELPEWMRQEIATNYPIYREPPPGTDERPNETSWTYFKKMVKPAQGGKGGH
ncbi:MAG: DUF1838 family protein [Steroidobacteraceae bacterium]|jgi:hypothetical protein|nr:DUF1838 family protein [Steroidobacteraceae bacterium]